MQSKFGGLDGALWRHGLGSFGKNVLLDEEGVVEPYLHM